MSDRRAFIQKIASVAIGLQVPWSFEQIAQITQGKIVTVTGAIAPSALGVCLPHEHLMSTFGAEKSESADYDQDLLLAQVAPYLLRVKSLGCQAIADCTAAYFGRDPKVLRTLSQRSGLSILTNTGFYGAANDRYVPDQVYQQAVETVAQGWINEFEQGIGDTGIRPGFIKIGVDENGLSAIDAKLVRAAAQTHVRTGLTTACHTGDNAEGTRAALAILQEEGVAPNAWIWTHAHKTEHLDDLLAAAKQGVWISLDGMSISTLDKHLHYLREMKQRGYLSQVLLSHDGNSFPRGGAIRPYETIFTTLLPRLKREGFTQQQINQLLIENPQRAFTIQKRMR